MMSFRPKLLEMRTHWLAFQQNTLIKISSISVLILILFSFLIVVMIYGKLPPQIPLWYSKPWGTERLSSPSGLYILPLMSIGIYIINSILAVFFTKDHLVFTQILFLSSLFVGLFSTIALCCIIWIIL